MPIKKSDRPTKNGTIFFRSYSRIIGKITTKKIDIIRSDILGTKTIAEKIASGYGIVIQGLEALFWIFKARGEK